MSVKSKLLFVPRLIGFYAQCAVVVPYMAVVSRRAAKAAKPVETQPEPVFLPPAAEQAVTERELKVKAWAAEVRAYGIQIGIPAYSLDAYVKETFRITIGLVGEAIAFSTPLDQIPGTLTSGQFSPLRAL